MDELIKTTRNIPISVSGQISSEILSLTEVNVAMEAFQRTLDTAVTIAKNHEDAKSERALIAAKKEIQLTAMELDTRRGIANDRNLHERRMMLIQQIGSLISNNAQALTPEILSAAQILLQVLREEK